MPIGIKGAPRLVSLTGLQVCCFVKRIQIRFGLIGSLPGRFISVICKTKYMTSRANRRWREVENPLRFLIRRAMSWHTKLCRTSVATRQLRVLRFDYHDNNSLRSSPVMFRITLLSALMMASANSRFVD